MTLAGVTSRASDAELSDRTDPAASRFEEAGHATPRAPEKDARREPEPGN